MNNLRDKLLRDGNLVGLKMRPARALIGWMSVQDAYTILAIPMVPRTPRPESVQKVQGAHRAVQSRIESLDQINVLSDPGEDLRGYLAELEGHPAYKQFIAKGCSVRVADLSKLGAIQPVVHLDHAEHSEHFRRLLPHARQEDMLSLAKITLPILPDDMGVRPERQKSSWVLRFTHPDARLVDHFSMPIDFGAGLSGMGYGFRVAVLPSFVQVARYRGRYFLKDGYHRSLMLLERRITHVPAIFEELSESRTLEVEGRFPDSTILASQAPRLPDYLRDDVAAVVCHPTFQKIITIRVTEERCWGL